jgi:TonB family protein
MEKLGYGVGVHKTHRAIGVVAGALMLFGAYSASAQTNPAGSAVDQAPSEAARRAALSPYRFILQNATAPARKPAPAAAPKPAQEAPAVAEPKRVAPPPVQQAAVQPSVAAPARTAPSEAAPASATAPESAVASLSRQPTEPPPRREIIPVRTDEPRLPAALMRERPHGTVRVLFEIQPDGTVSDAKVVSSTNRSLNRPTIDAVKAWKFEPVDEILSVETEVDYKFDN